MQIKECNHIMDNLNINELLTWWNHIVHQNTETIVVDITDMQKNVEKKKGSCLRL